MSKSNRAFKILCMLYGRVLRRQPELQHRAALSRAQHAAMANGGIGEGLEQLENRVLLSGTPPLNDTNPAAFTIPSANILPLNNPSQTAQSQAQIQFNPDPASPGSISGTVFSIVNGNGTESPSAGVTVFLDEAHTGVYTATDPSTTTAANGSFTFTNVASGNFSVDEILPAGCSQNPGFTVGNPALDFYSLPDNANGGTPNALPGSAYTPAQIANAYGLNQVSFPKLGTLITGNGAGQTIAIVDAYNDPNIASDLSVFDTQFGLAAPPSFKVVAEPDTPNASTTNGTNWALEESLDVEWTHALAPGANIVLVEGTSSSNLGPAIAYAESYPGVSAVSMSFTSLETAGEAPPTIPTTRPPPTTPASLSSRHRGPTARR